jgi:hypothetical protein
MMDQKVSGKLPTVKRKPRRALTARRVERTKTPGRYRDHVVAGLLLQISEDEGGPHSSSGSLAMLAAMRRAS